MSLNSKDMKTIVRPEEFFKEKVTTAILNQKMSFDIHMEFYLVNLLTDFIERPILETSKGTIDFLETPMVVVLQRALEADHYERIRIYKICGDFTLYVTGFFQDYFKQKSFDIEYYKTIGSFSYQSLSSLMRDKDKHFYVMYQNLSSRFSDLVEVLADVSESSNISQPSTDLLTVYERWMGSKSERLRKKLEENGIIPQEHFPKTRQ